MPHWIGNIQAGKLIQTAMTKEERDRVNALVQAAECLLLENVALKLVMEHRAVSNWQKLVNKLMEDEELMSGVHLRFADL